MSITLSPFAATIFQRTYAITPHETWEDCAWRVSNAVARSTEQRDQFFHLIRDRIFIPGGRYLYTAGRKIFQNANCFGFVAQDSREGWAKLLHDATMCLSMGGGIGVNYSDIRPSGSKIGRMGGTSSGPIALMQMVNEVGRHVMSGGARRSAIWAGLHWKHPNIQEFIRIKNWDDDIQFMKTKKFEYPAPLDMTNISVIIDNEYISNIHNGDSSTLQLHHTICDYMARTGEPAFRNQSRILQDDPEAITGNPCQEAVLHHNDSCNLGSIVMPRITSMNHLEEVTHAAIQFLYNGSILGDYPTPEIEMTVRKNRRIGLGIMGLHEYMILNGDGYKWSKNLQEFFSVFKDVSDSVAQKLNPKPVTLRAIAPTGTISIIAETTSGIEPIYCVAYKRRYQNGDKHYFQYVVDPTARRLITHGYNPRTIEDAYQLAHNFRQRLEVQAMIQSFIDQAISSTVNLPTYGSPGNQDTGYFAHAVSDYLPSLKGITFYPNNARAGQPLSPVSLDEAMKQEGVIFEEDGERCLNGVCGL